MDVFLHPGELRFGAAEDRMRTLLGSCLAIVMWHPAERCGGMAHCLLPTRPGLRRRGSFDPRFVDEALPLLFAQAVQRDTDPNAYLIKLFGGSSMMAPLAAGPRDPIGQLNARSAAFHLSTLKLAVAAQDLGGDRHRMLDFDLSSGDVWVRSGDQAPQREVLASAMRP